MTFNAGPGRKNVKVIINPTALPIYIAQVQQLKACKHLQDNDLATDYVLMNIFADLINPCNFLKKENYLFCEPCNN